MVVIWPVLVVRRRVATLWCVKVAVTVAVVGCPVSGSVEATRSPSVTCSMGLLDPSARRIRVPAGKQP